MFKSVQIPMVPESASEPKIYTEKINWEQHLPVPVWGQPAFILRAI
jgi:hypothetical protein